MRSRDLLFQLARTQKPEPRQLISRDVVKGRRVMRGGDDGCGRMHVGALSFDQGVWCLMFN